MTSRTPASSRGTYLNTGNGPTLQVLDIGHADYLAVIEPDTASWLLVLKEKLGPGLADGSLLTAYREHRDQLAAEMQTLRFGLTPSAVYFNPTDRCNLNCTYCYLSEESRKHGRHMSADEMREALRLLKQQLADVERPQIVFHGAEPMLNRDAMFAAIEEFSDDFNFGLQTNGTLLDAEAIDFLTAREISIGLSLDGHADSVADRLRVTWAGGGVSRTVMETIERLRGYPYYSVICTVTTENMHALSDIVDRFHGWEVPYCLLNPVRCTRAGARTTRPADHELAGHFLKALDRTHELYRETGRKLVVANFANVLIGIVAPTARRLMCDISPCGGGRCFFALAANGDLYPCSEFIGLPEFKGGNLFQDSLATVRETPAFRRVTQRRIEHIDPCGRCALRHFCGAPCPAEAHALHGDLDTPGAFCELYEEQVRYAFRLIAEGKENDYLWDEWSEDTVTTLELTRA